MEGRWVYNRPKQRTGWFESSSYGTDKYVRGPGTVVPRRGCSTLVSERDLFSFEARLWVFTIVWERSCSLLLPWARAS